MQNTSSKFMELIEIISRLRGPDGCPWDRKQTIESFKPYLIEEMYELIEAIDNDDTLNIMEEIGDLFFQILFLGNLYQEENRFGISDSLDSICRKMIRRHPHVFGDLEIVSERQLRQNWQQIKAREKKANGEQKSLFDFPRSLPALMFAQRVCERAFRSEKEQTDTDHLVENLQDQVAELTASLKDDDQDTAELFGEILYRLSLLGQQRHVNLENVLKNFTRSKIKKYE